MKRLCAWILALVLLLSATALASVMPEADKTVLRAGETVNVAVKLDAPIEGVYGLSYDLYFNDELFDYVPASSTEGDAISGVQSSAKAKTDAEGKKYVLISYVDLTGKGQTVAAGTLFTVAFMAKTDIAADAKATFELKKEKVRDTSRNEITGEAVDVPADKASLNVTIETVSPAVELGEQRTMDAKVGQEIEVPVTFKDMPTVGLAAFIVEFDSEKLSYAGVSLEGGAAEGNLNVAAVEDSANRLMVSTLGTPVTKNGVLCTLKFAVKADAAAGAAAITLPTVTTDDATYPMILDENMLPVGGVKYAELTVNVLTEPQVTEVKLDKTALKLELNGEGTLVADVTAEEGADTTVTWISGDETIATVADGKVTAVGVGETTITAKVGDKTATCTIVVLRSADEGYTVELTESQTITIKGEATVSIVVNVGKNDARKTYNAADVELKYDSAKLKYVGETKIGEVRITDDGAGTLKLIRYGADLNVGDVLAALKFKPQAAGKAKIEFVSAKIDESDKASTQDAPEATWLNDFVTITIGGHTVILPDIFEGDKATVPGEDYTFSAKETEHYDYSDVKATVDGSEVEVIDNGDGTYTIKAEHLTGDVTVTGNRTGKIYNVTITGEDTTGADKAQYGVDYTFTIDKKDGYSYTLSVSAPYTDNGDGTYTIAGKDITGDITINVTKTEEITPPAGSTLITIVGATDAEVEGGLKQTAPNGEDFTLKLIKDAAYDYVVKVGETELKPNADGSYTIPGSMINGTALTVTVEKTVATPAVEVVEYLKLKEAEGETSGQSMWLVLVSGKPVDGNVYSFDGSAMFTSEKYDGAYCYLMISGKTIEEVREAAALMVDQKAGTASAISYEGDVNGTKVVDINDAQLVYDMYRAKYQEFTATVAVENFLRADMDGSKNITVKDAAEIVAKVHAEFTVE